MWLLQNRSNKTTAVLNTCFEYRGHQLNVRSDNFVRDTLRKPEMKAELTEIDKLTSNRLLFTCPV